VDLNKASKYLKKSKNFFIFPVVKYSHPIQRAIYLNKNNKIEYVNKKFVDYRTQDLRQRFHDAGQFYFASKKTWFNTKKAVKIGIKIPSSRAIDIDDMEDWKKAELIFKSLNKNKQKK